jgi:ribose transport system permease protein
MSSPRIVDTTITHDDGNQPNDGTAVPDVTEPNEKRGAVRRRALIAAKFALPGLLVAFLVFFSLAEPDTFATTGTFKTIIATQAVLAVLALTALVPLVIGEFDLSIGAQLGLAAVLVPGFTSKQELGLATAVLLAVAATTVVGFLNGVLIAKLRLNSFITTIAMAALIQAVVLWYTGGLVIFDGIPRSLRSLAQNELFGIPLPAYYLFGVAVLLWYLLEHTPFGRYMEALGGSKDAARLSGLNVSMLTVLAFSLAGFLAGIAGVIQAAQLGTANPSVGPPLLLPAFAAAFLGATSIRVGRFNVWGTVIAVITISTGLTGLELMGVSQWVTPAFNGVALLLAVVATRYLQRDAR